MRTVVYRFRPTAGKAADTMRKQAVQPVSGIIKWAM